MEDSRNIQISEDYLPHHELGNNKTFFSIIYNNYIQYGEGLFSAFFTGTDSEVQRAILRNNFGLKNKEIESWRQRATRYNMTPEVFTFFLHVAMYSSIAGLDAAAEDWSKREDTLLAL